MLEDVLSPHYVVLLVSQVKALFRSNLVITFFNFSANRCLGFFDCADRLDFFLPSISLKPSSSCLQGYQICLMKLK